MKKYAIFLISILSICIVACSNNNDSTSYKSEEVESSNSTISNDGAYMPPNEEASNIPNENTPTANIVIPTPNIKQTITLWEKDKIPAYNLNYQKTSRDEDDFIPFIETFPAIGKIKGAILICPGGAFQFRSMQTEGYSIANRLSSFGYQCFVVSYRLSPYSQEVSALDLARAVRFVRSNAKAYGIDENNISTIGFSAGGILCGELALNNDGYNKPSSVDSKYVDDKLDYVSAKANAIGHIYSFYGRLSVANNNVEELRKGNLPPTFYAYGTRDPFYNQFNQNVEAVKQANVLVESHIFQNIGHGFGAGNENSNWISMFDAFLNNVFNK